MIDDNFTRQVVELRPYQSHAVHQGRQFFASGRKRVMVYAPTGAGKGELAVAFAQMAYSKGKRVLFLVHRKDLVRQQAERFAKYGIDVGILQGQNTYRPHHDITVGSIQTFSSRKNFGWQFNFDLVLIDEAHLCAGSKQYHELFRQWNNLPMIGLSATPFSKGLGKKHSWGTMFEDLIVVSTIRELVEQGYLVDCEAYAPSTPDLSKVSIVGGEYHQKQLGDAVDQKHLIGDIVTHWTKLARGKQTICFAVNIAHSKHIVDQFRAVGVDAEHIDCHTPEEERLDIIHRFRNGQITVLSNVSILAEGFDAPATEVMILARPTRSLIRYIQMAGRVLRQADRKTTALLLDHSGSLARLGFPTDDLPLELDDGKPKKSEGSRKSEKPKEKVCSSCGYVDKKKRHKCPACGFAPERKADVEVEAGELVKIKRRTAQDKQEIYSALKGYADSKGYQSGWIAHKYKELTGVWPRGMEEISGPMRTDVYNHIVSSRIRWAKGQGKARAV